MGLLVNGVWKTYDGKWASKDGIFRRSEARFRNHIGSDEFPAEAGRYHLYVCLACPWAHRTLIFRKLKGLESLIGVTAVHPHMLENGWEYKPEPEPLYGFHYHHQFYTKADPHYSGRVSVPMLWDKRRKTIVNNESAEIIRMFNSAFYPLTGNTDDYYPEPLRGEIDAVNGFVYDNVNNGVYKCGFATVQDAYEDAFDALFSALDTLELRLSSQRYLVGDHITEADWRLFTTLIRFDTVVTDPHYSGRVSVPMLWDKRRKTIVNNESAEIIRMFNSAFYPLTGNTDDYYPEPLRGEIDAVNGFVYDNVNNGVYKCGFATVQDAYEDAFDALFSALDTLELRLSSQRYLVGDHITEADWRLFTTLIRFDTVYYSHFKCNRNRICDMPNLWGYLRDLYQQPGIAETVNMEHIKQHYYYSHESINPTRIVPKGPDLNFTLPHHRTSSQETI